MKPSSVLAMKYVTSRNGRPPYFVRAAHHGEPHGRRQTNCGLRPATPVVAAERWSIGVHEADRDRPTGAPKRGGSGGYAESAVELEDRDTVVGECSRDPLHGCVVRDRDETPIRMLDAVGLRIGVRCEV